MNQRIKIAKRYAEELHALYEEHGSLSPAVVVAWAKDHPESALHGRFQWDDTKAAHEHRLWQARQVITEVRVEYAPSKTHQVYVSPIEERRDGYVALVDVLSDEQRRARFLAQALTDYQRLGEKYAELTELAGIRAAVERAVSARSSDAAA